MNEDVKNTLDGLHQEEASCCGSDELHEQNASQHNNNHADNNADNNSRTSELAACRAEAEMFKERFLRASADFANYKNRIDKDRAQWTQGAHIELLLALLPIVDNFDRALGEENKAEDTKKEQAAEREALLTGFALIAKELQKFLEKFKVTPITENTVFDPELHEALVQIDAPGKAAGEIVQVLEKGYRYKDTVLRPVKVTVAK